MVSPKRPPTNTELLKEIHTMQASISEQNGRLVALEAWKIATDAVAEYKKSEPQPSENKLNKDLVKVVLTFLGVIASLIYLAQGLLK